MGYYEHKFKLSFALDDISERGLPVDRIKQEQLRDYIVGEEIRLLSDLQQQIPQDLLPANRKEGYKSLPRDLRAVLKERELLVKGAKLDYYTTNHYDLCNQLGYFWRELGPLTEGLVKLLPFNPNSSDQLLDYIRYKDYRVPLHIDTGQPTTGQAEIEKLIEETDDNVLRVAQKMRKLTKLKGTYCSGEWIPGEDGRVHGTFRFGSATQQTTATKPNVQQFLEHYDPEDAWIVDIATRLKDCIRAEPGHKLVKVDARGAHGRMQGWLAEDAAYYRLANLDLHSYNTAHYLDLPDKNELLAMEDVSLKKRLKEIKKEHEYDRNFKLKRVAYLMQFMGGADKAFKILTAFESVLEVEELIKMIKRLFPRSFVDFPKSVEDRMRKHPRLISPHGCCRWMWDQDIQQGVAFSVANPFHCHVQSALVRLFEQGVFSKFETINFTHDAVWLHPREELVEEAIAAVKVEFERPSEILVNSLGPFFCLADSQVGDRLSEMEDV